MAFAVIVLALAAGLFQRAIVQSGHDEMARRLELTQKLTKAVAAQLGASAALEELRTGVIGRYSDAAQLRASLRRPGPGGFHFRPNSLSICAWGMPSARSMAA